MFVLLKNVVIKRGTVLFPAPLQRGGKRSVETVVAMGKNSTAYFNMSIAAIEDMPKNLIKPL